MGFLLFCFCVINWYLKNKKQQKTTTTVYRLKKKITAFYTTEILSQDFAKQELGSSYFFAVDGESSVVSPHEGECTNLGALPSILYIFIILIVQNCIIFCNLYMSFISTFSIQKGVQFICRFVETLPTFLCDLLVWEICSWELSAGSKSTLSGRANLHKCFYFKVALFLGSFLLSLKS